MLCQFCSLPKNNATCMYFIDMITVVSVNCNFVHTYKVARVLMLARVSIILSFIQENFERG